LLLFGEYRSFVWLRTCGTVADIIVAVVLKETDDSEMVKTRHGGGEINEGDESVDIEAPHSSHPPKHESLETKESCVNVSVTATFLSAVC